MAVGEEILELIENWIPECLVRVATSQLGAITFKDCLGEPSETIPSLLFEVGSNVCSLQSGTIALNLTKNRRERLLD